MKQYNLITDAGTDEVGRGCLAGPVTICSLRLHNDSLNHLLRDSKALSAQKREYLYEKIIENSDYKIISIDAQTIDKINILQATMRGMAQSLEMLNPEYAYIDGNKIPKTNIKCEAVIKGDSLIPAISAASIIAKVTRDKYMTELDKIYPQYGFALHKGYGTALHHENIKKYGIICEHRKSFAPIKYLFEQDCLL